MFVVFPPQFLDKLLAIIPRNRFHRQVFFALELAGIIAHDFLPLFLGHGVHAHVESLRQRDLVLGFITFSFFFLLWTSHHEAPWRYPDEFHAAAVGEGLGRIAFFFLGRRRDSDNLFANLR